MGQQINFYFADEDDEAMSEFLTSKELLCIPRLCATDTPVPSSPNLTFDCRTKLFLPQFKRSVLGALTSPNRLFWHLATDGLYIDWRRNKSNTKKSDRYSGPPHYSEPGRFYFPTTSSYESPSKEVAESERELAKVMRAITRNPLCQRK